MAGIFKMLEAQKKKVSVLKGQGVSEELIF